MKTLNYQIMLSNINEALDELENIKSKLSDHSISEVELQIALRHTYHHMNFAWNIRYTPTEKYAKLSDKDFEKWGKYPAEIEEDDLD